MIKLDLFEKFCLVGTQKVCALLKQSAYSHIVGISGLIILLGVVRVILFVLMGRGERGFLLCKIHLHPVSHQWGPIKSSQP